ncbi:MAG: response regulator transcription factor [Planctomycetota bacterium]|jgi:FixJ family two-component response regulator
MRAETTVFIVDDDQAMRDGISLLVKSVGLRAKSFADAQDFLDYYSDSEPGCLVLDVRMPGMSGIELHEELIRCQIMLPVIFLTGHGDIPMGVRAMKAGAVDFIEKPPCDQALLDAIQRAVTEDQERRLHLRERDIIHGRLSRLTTRERQVMEYLVEGMSDKQIAGELGISVRGAAFHRAHILEKMEAGSLVELAQVISRLDGATKGRAIEADGFIGLRRS